LIKLVSSKIMKISNILTEWYKKNARDLPWRHTLDPYRIWISEIILQQTQVRQGFSYYNRFIQKYPDVAALASATEEELLKLWQGLGYYSRAGNLLAASKQIISEYNGKIPDNFKQLRKLSGVGDYTAGAIASIAFNEPVVAIDGNVSRVISRISGINLPVNSSEGKKLIYNLVSDILDKKEPGIFNQAMMEFGALQCKPANPACDRCPLNQICVAFLNGMVSRIPVRTSRNKTRTRWFNYFIISCREDVIIQQRKSKDIWKSLFQFPLIETSENRSRDHILKEFVNHKKPALHNFIVRSISGPVTHQLTHQRIIARFFHLELMENMQNLPDGWITTQWSLLKNYPVPRLIEKYLYNRLIF